MGHHQEINPEDDTETEDTEGNNPPPHEALASYSLAYLKFIAKMIYLLDKKDTFTFHMKTDQPLLVEIVFPLNHIGKGKDGDIDEDEDLEEFLPKSEKFECFPRNTGVGI